MMFRRKPDSLIGLDIGATSVKLVELSKRDGHLRLESCGIEPVPPLAALETPAYASETHISDAQSVGEAIKRLARRTRPTTKNAAVAIGGAAAFTEVIEMDASLSDEELEDEIALRAADHLPFPLADAAIDFEVLHLSEHDPTQVEVLLAACRQDDAERLEAVVATGGLKARALDVEALAIARAFSLLQPAFHERPDAAIFDIGANSTTLAVFVGDKLIHAREAAFGGRLLAEEIQRSRGISAAQAELAHDGELADETILSQFRDSVLDQMTRALQFFYAANPSGHIDQIYLAGGVSAMPGLVDLAVRALGTPVAVADPFADVILPESVDALELTADSPALMLACGLALRRFAP